MELRPWRWRATNRKTFSVLGSDSGAESPVAAIQRAESTVGNGTTLSVLMAPLLWLARSVRSIDLNVSDADGDVRDEPDMLALVQKRLLFQAAIDLALYGNAYIEIERGSMSQPERLIYHSPTHVSPRVSGAYSNEIVYYEIRKSAFMGSVSGYGMSGFGFGQSAGALVRKVPAEDMLHLASGIDPHYPAIGYSPILALLMDAASDVEAGRAVASVLRNQALLGLFLSPKPTAAGAGAGKGFDESVAKKWQENINRQFTGAERGKTMVTSFPVDVSTTVADIDKLALSTIRGISGVRVCAVLGIPASVVGLEEGLRQTKVGATLRDLRGIAWENAVIPTLDTILDGLNMKLAPEFQNGDLRYSYELPEGHVAATTAQILADRATKLYASGIITRNEARIKVGEEPDDAGGDEYINGRGGQRDERED